jgi:hypothetical protein
MKKTAKVFSYLLHPLMMSSLGLLIILNSGTYFSLFDPAAKRAIIFVMALGTLVFPLMMLPVLYYRQLTMGSGKNATVEDQRIPQVIILVLYIITYIYFKRLPLSHFIHAYVLSVTATLLMVMVLNLRFRVSLHTAALGGVTGLIVALIFLYETPLQGFLMLALFSGGLAGSSRLALGDHLGGVLSGFFLGLAVVLITLLVY